MVGLINHIPNSIFEKNYIQRVFPTPVTVAKEPMGDDLDCLVTKLAQLGVSLTQYQHAMQL